MADEPADSEQRRRVCDAIGSWRDGLVNLSGSNRLLNFRARKTSSVPIVDPEPSDVVRQLAAGTQFAFRGPSVELAKEDEPEPAVLPAGRGRRRIGVLRTTAAGSDLRNALRNLLRRSHQEYLDRGLRILYLAVGSLEWTDATDTAFSSPLLLIPVELIHNGPRELPYLKAAEDDPVLNPALALKLADSDVQLPVLQDLDELDPMRVLEQVRRVIAGRRGWRVEDTAVLSYFTFAKEAMYRDLLENDERIARYPAIVALAAGGRGDEVGDFGFDEIQDHDVDELAPIDRTPLVLDADSSQRACIAAAVAGRSFVMDGPPGTGKSQTIANMIGALLHAGRTVLFVSEKAAALDVVRNRLTDVGLDALLLELHSSKATRKEVAAELGRALSHRPVTRSGVNAVDLEQLRRRQDELNRYAAAMNEPRAPFGMSLHAAIGRLSELSGVPAAPATGRPVSALTPALFGEIRRLAKDLARAWRPALQGSSYVWRDVRQGYAMTSRLSAALREFGALDEVMKANKPVVDAFGFASLSRAEQLATMLEHYASRPPDVPEQWLTGLSSDELDAAVGRLGRQVQAVRVRQQEVTHVTGTVWSDIPSPDGLAALDLRRLDGLVPAPMPVDQMTGSAIEAALQRLRSDSAQLGTLRSELDDAAGLLRLSVPRTFDDADALLFVAATADEADRPEAAWLSREKRSSAIAALDHLSSACVSLDAADAAARRYYEDSALRADAAALDERFRTRHTGLRRLSGSYRQDKATVATFTRDGIAPVDAHRNLGLVVEWQRAVAALDATAPSYARDLGSYFHGRATDCVRAGRAIERAAAIAQRYPDADLRGVAVHVSMGGRTSPALVHAAGTAAAALATWRAALDERVEFGPRPQLLAGRIVDAVSWIDEHTIVLASARDVVRQLDAATGRTWTVGEGRRVLQLRRAADEAAEALDADAHRHQTVCGALFRGPHTDLDALHAAADWTRALHVLAGGVLTSTQAEALAGSVDVGPLRTAATAWRARRADVIDAFDPVRRADLADEFDDSDGARELLEALLEDTAGQDEWLAYRNSRDELVRLGLGEAIEFCVREQMRADQVPDVIEKAVLSEWVDHHIASDGALRPVRAQDRDAAVAEFRELDRRVVATAVGSIVDVCNERRPRNLGGQAGVIRREAEKKRKHMPVRELVQRARDVAQAIKPCFMMSPLAVSQYLPSDLEFDVVIFDEASQVRADGRDQLHLPRPSPHHGGRRTSNCRRRISSRSRATTATSGSTRPTTRRTSSRSSTSRSPPVLSAA